VTSSSTRGRDPASLRRHNVRVLLRHLHLHGPTSRAHLGKVTGLTRSAIADLVGELTERGLAVETGPSQTTSGRGRPPLIVAPCPDTARALAVAVEVDTVRIRRIGFGGALLEGAEVPHEAGQGEPERSIRQIAELVNEWISDDDPPIALGVAVPGLVRAEDGMVARAPNLEWHELDLGAQLRAGTGVSGPVVIGNEARLATLAEHRRGAGQQSADLVYISAEVGVGGGIIARNRLVTGTAGYGGELGHMITNPGGRACHCGGRGCWETEIGADALLRQAGVRPKDRHAALDELLTAAARGDSGALDAMRALCTPVAIGLANLVNVFNPERVVLGGLLQHLAQHVGEDLRKTLDELRGLPELPVDLRPAEFGEDGRLLGAAEIAIDSFLNQLG
jgi:predicted NBD/HSP70 family sugar kinase